MRKKKTVVLLTILSIAVSCVTGCSKKNDLQHLDVSQSNPVESAISSDSNSEMESPQITESQEVTDVLQETADVKPSEEVLPSKEPESKGFTFKDVANLAFIFSSGAGAWSTELDIREDGSFSGTYCDSDMGDTGDKYPYGTYYYSSFRGYLEEPVKVNEYTYSTKIKEISLSDKPGTEVIEDEKKWVYSEPYGMNDAKDIYIYLPGAPVKDLPEEFVQWAYSSAGTDTVDKKLPFYGLYNVKPQLGFSSYEIKRYPIDDEIDKVAQKAKELEHKLDDGNITENEMNLISYDLYKLWDDELNSMWKRMKEVVAEDEMKTVLKEQRKWIKEKEQKVKEAEEEVGGGSLAPFVKNGRATEFTRIRVYELAKYLRK